MKKTLIVFLVCVSQTLIAQTYDEDVVMKACSCIYNAEGNSIDSIVNSCLVKALYHSLAEDNISIKKIMQDYSNPKNIPDETTINEQTTFADYLDMLYKNCSATQYLIEKNPTYYSEMLDSAASYLTFGNSQKALSTYARLIRYYPESPEAYFGLGLISFSDNDYVTTARLMKHAYMIYSSQESNRIRDCKEYLKASYYYLKTEGKDSLFAAVAEEFLPPIYLPENFDQLKNIELNNEIDCRLMEPQILICCNYILSTPVNDKNLNRKYAIEAVKRWMLKTPNYIYHVDKDIAGILDIKGNVLAVFVTSMAKFSIENPEQGNNQNAVTFFALNTTLDYAANKANNIQLTGELKKMIKARKKT